MARILKKEVMLPHLVHESYLEVHLHLQWMQNLTENIKITFYDENLTGITLVLHNLYLTQFIISSQ
jgi:hypothetical protein